MKYKTKTNNLYKYYIHGLFFSTRDTFDLLVELGILVDL